jgi:hypothetical protein
MFFKSIMLLDNYAAPFCKLRIEKTTYPKNLHYHSSNWWVFRSFALYIFICININLQFKYIYI